MRQQQAGRAVSGEYELGFVRKDLEGALRLGEECVKASAGSRAPWLADINDRMRRLQQRVGLMQKQRRSTEEERRAADEIVEERPGLDFYVHRKRQRAQRAL